MGRCTPNIWHTRQRAPSTSSTLSETPYKCAATERAQHFAATSAQTLSCPNSLRHILRFKWYKISMLFKRNIYKWKLRIEITSHSHSLVLLVYKNYILRGLFNSYAAFFWATQRFRKMSTELGPRNFWLGNFFWYLSFISSPSVAESVTAAELGDNGDRW